MIWHSSDANDILKELGTDANKGLDSAEVFARIKKYGENRISFGGRNLYKEATKRIFEAQNIALMILALVLTVTGAIAGKPLWFSPIIIILIILANAFLGAYSAVKNENVLKELKEKTSLSAKVLRDGEILITDQASLVPGDIVFLEEGDFIPADGRILEESALICDEFAVTGDSAPVEKNMDAMFEDICPLNERSNMVYYGCFVTFGQAKIVVTDTAKATELGKIKQIREQTEETGSDTKKYLRGLGKHLKLYLAAASVIIFVLGVLLVKGEEGQSFSDLVLNLLTLSLSVYAVSIGKALPRLETSATSFAVFGMFKRNALFKNPKKIETLGRVSLIISDKTGTLTRNEMTMTSFFDGQKIIPLTDDMPSEKAITVIRTGALCCDVKSFKDSLGKQKEIGDATELGIISALKKYCKINKAELENIYPRMASVPFSSSRKLMTTVNMINNRPFAVVKGAPEAIFEKVSVGDIAAAKKAAEKMGESGERIIAVAIKPLDEVPTNPVAELLESNLTLLGLFGMSDSLSASTKNAIKEAKTAGIKTIMITGDAKATACAIAKELGILCDDDTIVTGDELRAMSDEELTNRFKTISVYCETTASDKTKVVKIAQELGETVAVTGDTVGDLEAMKIADVSVAMGRVGKDIARGAADLIVADNSFISILNAVKTARNNLHNILHGTQCYFALLIAEIISLILGFIIFRKPLFTAQSILLINTSLALLLTRALSSEPDRKNSMLLPPKDKKEGIFTSISDLDFIPQGLSLAALSLLVFGLNRAENRLAATFAAFSIMLIFLTFSQRICSSIYHEGFKVGKNMLITLPLSLVAILLLLITPLSYLFGINGVLAGNVFAAIGLGIALFLIFEVVKFLRKNNKKS